ncbi:MAG: hypothetical protein MUE81_08045 [Thermoflexibacter sp.]|jgi:hypothetical protein|nr:hypothetical protein [Thermoflexibacter sp.]
MKNGIFIIFLTFVLGCMKLPEQPVLSNSEKSYFGKIEAMCGCKVKREIEPLIKKEEAVIDDKAHYLILLEDISCKLLENEDSLKKVGKEIAKKLHYNVLGNNFNYFYKEITVGYTCKTTSTGGVVQYFDYTLDELEK